MSAMSRALRMMQGTERRQSESNACLICCRWAGISCELTFHCIASRATGLTHWLKAWAMFCADSMYPRPFRRMLYGRISAP